MKSVTIKKIAFIPARYAATRFPAKLMQQLGNKTVIRHTNNLIVEEKVDAPTTFWGVLKNKILYGQSNLCSKKYRCQNCKSLLNDLPIQQEN